MATRFYLAFIMQSLQILIFLQSCGISAVMCEQTSTAPLSQVVLQLNTAYKTNLNIFINLENNCQDTLDLQLLDTPSIQLQLSANFSYDFRIIGRFTEKSLIVAYINMPPLDPLLADLLPRLLWELHELHIIFITGEDPSTWQGDLYRYCFKNGFINVLLIQQLNQTVKLYSYIPYPVIQNQRLAQLEDYLNRWRQLRNFHKFPLRTISFTIEPRIFKYVNRQGQLVYAGYMYHAMKEFARRHNSTIQILKEVPKESLYNTVIALFASKDMDFICYPNDLILNQTSTAPLHLQRCYIAVPHARPLDSYLYFSRPFTRTVWLAIIATIGYGMLMLYGSNRNGGSEIGEHFLSSWCHLLFIPQRLMNFSNWQQIAIHLIMMLTGFILTNFYLALLSSMLTSGLFEPQYNTLDDLARAPYPLLLEHSYAEQLKDDNSLPAGVRKRILIVDPRVVDASRISLNTSYMYIGCNDRLEGILYQQHLLKVPLFKLTTQSFMDGLMSFPVVTGLPYLNMLNVYLRRIFECGILTKMKSDAWQETIQCGLTKLLRDEGTELKSFDLEFYYFAFGLWAVGLGLAMLCLVLELLRSYQN